MTGVGLFCCCLGLIFTLTDTFVSRGVIRSLVSLCMCVCLCLRLCLCLSVSVCVCLCVSLSVRLYVCAGHLFWFVGLFVFGS